MLLLCQIFVMFHHCWYKLETLWGKNLIVVFFHFKGSSELIEIILKETLLSEIDFKILLSSCSAQEISWKTQKCQPARGARERGSSHAVGFLFWALSWFKLRFCYFLFYFAVISFCHVSCSTSSLCLFSPVFHSPVFYQLITPCVFKFSSSPLFVSLSVLSCPCVPVSPIPVSPSRVSGCYFVFFLDLYFAVGFHFMVLPLCLVFVFCMLCIWISSFCY